MTCSCSPSWTRVVWSWWPQQPRGHQGHVHESCPNDGRDRVLVSCGAEFSSVAQMRISPRLYRAGLIPALFWSQPTCERSRVSVRSCDQVCPTLTSPDHQPVVLLLFHLACYYQSINLAVVQSKVLTQLASLVSFRKRLISHYSEICPLVLKYLHDLLFQIIHKPNWGIEEICFLFPKDALWNSAKWC